MSSADSPPEPETVGFSPGAIPDALTSRDQWICWRFDWKDERDEWTKVPVDPRTGGFAKTTDPDTWTSFAQAAEYHRRGASDTAGLGFVFDKSDMIVGVDLDDCRDPDTGEPTDEARSIIERLDSWTEVSPSGTGYHVFAQGVIPDDGSRGDMATGSSHIEMYDQTRFFTVTGDHVGTTPGSVTPAPDVVKDLHAEYVADDDTDAGGSSDGAGASSTPSEIQDIDDADLIETAKNAENGDTFAQLWNGNTAGYPSHSEADQALCNYLAFWTGGDRSRMDRLFRQSGLHREKWDEDRGAKTYGELTIDSAITAVSDQYEPGEGGSSPPEPKGLTDEKGDPVDDDGAAVVRPDNFCAEAGINPSEGEHIADLNDKQKAAATWRLIKRSDEYHVRAHRDTGALWAYESGVWDSTGERTLQFAARKAVNPENYGANLLNELKAQVRADPYAEIDDDTLGLEPGAVAVENGYVDLRAAAGDGDALRPLEPEDYALAKLPVEYDPDATSAPWREFVADVVESAKIDAVQEYVGYTLHRGEMPFNRALLLVGSGANGKSTFLNVVRELLGPENTETKPVHKFDKDNAVADLYGKLANIDADLSEGSLSSRGLATFKRLVGDDRVTGRHLYEDAFTFEPAAKHLYACNQVPDVSNIVSDNDTAFWRRWVIVQFPNYFPPRDRDPTLEGTLTSDEHLSGVLNWAIEGWGRLMEQGAFTNIETTPDETRRLWQSWGDSADEFLSQCVETDPSATNVTTGEAWEVYKEWCRREGKDATGQRDFTNTAKASDVDLGYKTSVRTKRHRSPRGGYKAFGLTDDAPDLDAVLADDDGDDTDDDDGTMGTGLDSFGS